MELGLRHGLEEEGLIRNIPVISRSDTRADLILVGALQEVTRGRMVTMTVLGTDTVTVGWEG